jgi:hypothetical protein
LDFSEWRRVFTYDIFVLLDVEDGFEYFTTEELLAPLSQRAGVFDANYSREMIGDPHLHPCFSPCQEVWGAFDLFHAWDTSDRGPYGQALHPGPQAP